MRVGLQRLQVGTSAAVALLAVLPLGRGGDEYLHVDSTVTNIIKGQTRVLDHCFYEQSTYMPYLPDQWGNVSAHTYEQCQRRCSREVVCYYFTFFSNTSECRLAGRDAIFQKSPEGKGHAVAGPRICPKFPAGCTEMPGKGFPGQTANESKFAWPSHRVPENMECWAKNWTSNSYSPCRTFKVLESTFTGWPGKCRGMRMVLIPHLESCESYCKKKVICAAYQEVQVKKPFGPVTCWHADATSGIDCYERKEDPDFAPLSAKRFMRGNVRVLMTLRGVEVLGLYNVFPETYFIHVADAARACRYQCYSNLLCQYWQYYLESGCWVEDPLHTNGNPAQFPATTSSWLVGSPRSRTVLDGEYIQHVCFDAGEPGRQVQSKWTLLGEHNYCSEDILKNLGGTGGNWDACKQLTLADAACGNQMYSDGWQCACVRRGEVCEVRSGNTDSSLYQHAMIRKEGKLMHFAKTHGAHMMKEHGFQLLDRNPTEQEGKIFEATITVEGLHFSFIGPTQEVILIGRYVNLAAGALGIPRSSIQDLHGNPGSMELVHGALPNRTKVSFAVRTTEKRTTAADIRDCFQNESFAKQFENVTVTYSPKAVDNGLTISSVAVIRRGGALPSHNTDEGGRFRHTRTVLKALKKKGGGYLDVAALTALFLLGGVIVGIVLACQQNVRGGGSSMDFGASWLGGGESSSSGSDSGEAESAKGYAGRQYVELRRSPSGHHVRQIQSLQPA